MKNKILAVILMTMIFLASCTDDTKKDDTTTNTTTSTVSDGETVPTQSGSETARILPNLPAYDVLNMEGRTLRVLTTVGESYETSFFSHDIVAEEETGDPINDAVYKRNRAIEAKYNFTIEQVPTKYSDYPRSAAIRELRMANAAGDDYFDVCSMITLWAAQAAKEGLFVDLNSLLYMDLKKPWWDQNAIAGMSIGKRLFIVSGDSVLINRDMCPAVLFNKKLITDLQLENPYELVRNGQWTLNKWYNMVRTATADLNGNGKLDTSTDRYGLALGLAVDNMTLGEGAGMRIADKDANDLPVLVVENERTYNVMGIVDNIIDSNIIWSRGDGPTPITADNINEDERVFAENRILFLATDMYAVKSLRGMDVNFGILPMPRYDEHQGEWRNSVSVFDGQALGVPSFHDSDERDRIGFMLEAVASESRYTVIPAYRDIQLEGKFIRDEESSEMLDIIFSSMVWDPGIVYDWLNRYFIAANYNTVKINSASGFESGRHLVEAAMKRTVDALAVVR